MKKIIALLSFLFATPAFADVADEFDHVQTANEGTEQHTSVQKFADVIQLLMSQPGMSFIDDGTNPPALSFDADGDGTPEDVLPFTINASGDLLLDGVVIYPNPDTDTVYDDTAVLAAIAANLAAINGHIASDLDIDPTNEIQVADGTTITGVGSSADPFVAVGDGTGTDDQQLTRTGDTLNLEDGGSVDLSDLRSPANLDNDSTNELGIIDTTAGTYDPDGPGPEPSQPLPSADDATKLGALNVTSNQTTGQVRYNGTFDDGTTFDVSRTELSPIRSWTNDSYLVSGNKPFAYYENGFIIDADKDALPLGAVGDAVILQPNGAITSKAETNQRAFGVELAGVVTYSLSSMGGFNSQINGVTGNLVARNSEIGVSMRSDGLIEVSQDMTSNTGPVFAVNRMGSTGTAVNFYQTPVGVTSAPAGSITVTPTTVSYNTTSDLDEKTGVEEIDPADAEARLRQAAPIQYRFKRGDGSVHYGFGAQDVALAYPLAVTGTQRTPEQAEVFDQRTDEPFDVAAFRDAFIADNPEATGEEVQAAVDAEIAKEGEGLSLALGFADADQTALILHLLDRVAALEAQISE